MSPEPEAWGLVISFGYRKGNCSEAGLTAFLALIIFSHMASHPCIGQTCICCIPLLSKLARIPRALWGPDTTQESITEAPKERTYTWSHWFELHIFHLQLSYQGVLKLISDPVCDNTQPRQWQHFSARLGCVYHILVSWHYLLWETGMEYHIHLLILGSC